MTGPWQSKVFWRHSPLLCGATGLVGRHCLRLLSHSPAFRRVVVLTRWSLSLEITREVNVGKFQEHVLPFDELKAHSRLFRADQILCALGTIIVRPSLLLGERDDF